ncbi:MAG TPA: glycosyltransferase family 4 protein [Actinomycetota bacterium]|nr:glycosyltransferase family 4 protein [Actinomycetota bacterium]
MDVPRVLVVTNDFPPRVGGVQQYVWNLVRHLPHDRVAVLAPNWAGWREHDEGQPFAVHRWPSSFVSPSSDLARRVRSLVREHRADVVLFGHGFPLPLIGPNLASRGLPYAVLTHGVEAWVARVPALSAALRKALHHARAVTAVSRYTARAIRTAVPAHVPLSVLYPGVDVDRFAPSVDGTPVRDGWGLDASPMIVCVSRLVPRKGQDILIRSMEFIRRLVPEAVLVLAGGGPYRPKLEAEAARAPSGSVVFVGEVSDEDAPQYYAAADVFAMPCRSRWGGLEVEGFGIVFLEAAATGKAVVAGRSGGADEAVADEETGLLVEGREPKAVALAIAQLLSDREAANRMGSAGRARAENEFTWPIAAEKLSAILTQAAR